MQQRGESIQSYVSDLKNKASTCEFGDLKDEMIKDRLVCGIENDKLRRSLLREEKLTLQKAIELCQINELSEQRMKELASTTEVHDVKFPRRNSPNIRQKQQRQQAPGYRNESGKFEEHLLKVKSINRNYALTVVMFINIEIVLPVERNAVHVVK